MCFNISAGSLRQTSCCVSFSPLVFSLLAAPRFGFCGFTRLKTNGDKRRREFLFSRSPADSCRSSSVLPPEKQTTKKNSLLCLFPHSSRAISQSGAHTPDRPLKMNMDVELDGIFRHNSTYDYEDYMYEGDFESRGSKGVLYLVLYSVVLVVGLLGNGLLLAVLAQRRRSWSISDTFVLHLSIADILLLLTLPLWATQAVHQSGWCFGVFLCKTSGVVFNINFYCGVLLLVCICMDRCMAIVHSTQLYSQKKPRLAHISCLLVWICCLIFTIPDWIFLVTTEDLPKTLCDVPSHSQSITVWLISHLIHHMLGLLLLVAVLIIICSSVLPRLQCISKDPQKLRPVKVILPLVVVFYVFWLPYIITLIVDTFRSSSKKPDDSSDQSPEGSLKTILRVTFAVGCMHACIRPLLYLGLCGSFRKQTLAMLRCAPAESESLPPWELGVGEDALPDQSHEAEELKQMKSVDHQVQCF